MVDFKATPLDQKAETSLKDEIALRSRLTLGDQIADQIGWKIATRDIPPGERIREVDWTERLGVSRPLVREVLQRLEVEGLVEIVPWKGARVPILTATQLSDLFELFSLSFGFTCKHAASRATQRQLQLVAAGVAKLEEMASSNATTAEDYERGRLLCHRLLDGCLGELSDMVRTRPVLRRMRHQFAIDSAASRELREASATRWRTLLGHLESRDAVGAEAQARSMVMATRDVGLKAHRETVVSKDAL